MIDTYFVFEAVAFTSRSKYVANSNALAFGQVANISTIIRLRMNCADDEQKMKNQPKRLHGGDQLGGCARNNTRLGQQWTCISLLLPI